MTGEALAEDASLEARLTVDLTAIAANWRALNRLSGGTASAVVKADAYGCGAARVGPALARAGAREYFVALPSEGAALRAALGVGPNVFVLGGATPADYAAFRENALIPVLNSAEQAQSWFAAMPGTASAVQLDTGMNRLGMEAEEFRAIQPLPDSVLFVMSHLACADEPAHPQNAAQLRIFRDMTDGLGIHRSLAATGGILLGPEFRLDLTRPGIGLFGGLPFEAARPVVTLELPVVQIRNVAPGETVGYGAAWTAVRPSRIATVAAGYADGLHRALGPGGAGAYREGRRLPFAGRVSMDLITLDATEAPDLRAGDMVELLGPHQTVDQLAQSAATIGYEILTGLGRRYARRYRDL